MRAICFTDNGYTLRVSGFSVSPNKEKSFETHLVFGNHNQGFSQYCGMAFWYAE